MPKQAVFHILGATHTGDLRETLEGELMKMIIMSIINCSDSKCKFNMQWEVTTCTLFT